MPQNLCIFTISKCCIIKDLFSFCRVADNLLIAYISRGTVHDLEEQNATLREVTKQQALLDNRVRINAYMPVEERSATVLFERTFMRDLATRWNVHSDPRVYRPSDVRPGHFFALNRSADLADTAGRFYELFTSGGGSRKRTSFRPLKPPRDESAASPLVLSLPHRDLEGGGLVMSMSQAFYYKVSASLFPLYSPT